MSLHHDKLCARRRRALWALCRRCHAAEHAGDAKATRPRRCAPGWESVLAAQHVFDEAHRARANPR